MNASCECLAESPLQLIQRLGNAVASRENDTMADFL